MIQKTLLENLKNQNVFFIFPTQLACDTWQDRIIQISDIKAVASERFIAWDKFKAESIKNKQQTKTAVPSTMRLVFASQLIEENAENPFFTNLIVPEYAKTASGFVNWIASILPSLFIWKKYFDKNNTNPDEQDKDLLKLYEKYAAFLNEHNFFDPAWETPPFEPDGHKYFIFYPEILSDWAEYEQILKDSEDITIINLTEKQNDDSVSNVYFFNNSRNEIKSIVNHLSYLHYEKKIPWNEIAISIPDIESYGPYIERELSINEIPYVLRNAKPLSANGAGCLFNSLYECYINDFNFDSLRDLLLNPDFPWNDKTLNSDLIQFGKDNHCICGFEYKNKIIDVWKESFKEKPLEYRLSLFYEELKTLITKLVESDSFEKVSENYFIFRNKFFDINKCSKKSDLILSRCITELGALIDLEQKYNCEVPSYFKFFTDYLSDIQYLEKTDNIGVHILPYKTGSCVPFACHILVDSSQQSLSVIYKQLSFLREDKRLQLLKHEDSNITEKFIQLYQMHSYSEPAYFTASEKTFTGYSQSSSYLNPVEFKKEEVLNPVIEKNLYFQEKEYLLNSKQFPSKLPLLAKTSFNNWVKSQKTNSDNNSDAAQELLNSLKQQITSKPIQISQTQLKAFYSCPRSWFLSYISNLDEQNNNAELINFFVLGNLNHKVFELYCIELKKQNLPIHTEIESGLPEQYKNILLKSIDNAINYCDDYYSNCYLQKQLLETGKQNFVELIVQSVNNFSKVFEGCKVVYNENSYKFTPENKNYALSGRIDLLLQDPVSKEYYLIDFKSSGGGIPTENMYALEGEEKEENDQLPLEEQIRPDFQMPFYIELLKNSEEKINVTNACFYNIKDSACSPVFGNELARRMKENPDNAKTIEDFMPTISKMYEFVENYVSRISNADFSLNNNVQDFTKCAGCSFNSICRKTFNVNRKE